MAAPAIWAGMDIGDEHHHCVVIDASGRRLLSRRVLNGQAELTALIDDVLALAIDVQWAVDVTRGGAALLIGLLLSREQPVAYLTGLAVHRAAATYRGEGKTDAKDAFVIADQARLRQDLWQVRPGDDVAIDLRILTGRRLDLVRDRTRQINRLRALLLEISPALERALDLTNKGPLVLLTGYQTPGAIREFGAARLQAWLAERGVRRAAALARLAVQTAQSQSIALPGEAMTAAMAARLAHAVLTLDTEIADLDAMIEAKLVEHPVGRIVLSLPGMGHKLTAEFIAATGGDLGVFGSADRLAGYAGPAPRPRDSGRVSGNLHRPRRFHRGLLRAVYLSAMVSLTCCPVSKRYYQRKREEGKGHKQALLALARRRIGVLWAMIRDGSFYDASLPPRSPAPAG